MSIPCPKLRYLVDQTRMSQQWLDLLEDDLKWLVLWNNNDKTVSGAAGGVLGAVNLLRKLPEQPAPGDMDQLNYLLDALRLALRALWPYVEEAPDDEFDILPAWYNVTLVWVDLPAPTDDQVPSVVSSLWGQVAKLRTLESLRELAHKKGLWLLRNDVPYTLRYQVIVPGKPSVAQCYKDAARLIEAYPDSPYRELETK